MRKFYHVFITFQFQKGKHLLLYGFTLAILIFSLKWLQWKVLIVGNSIEIYIGMIALFFTMLGIWVATQLTKGKVKTVVIEKPIYPPHSDQFVINEVELDRLNLSNREYEVLQLVVKGHSNADIAEDLFISLSTVKTHVSSLLLKMHVKSRTRVITEAKRLGIVA